jgi:hypothetical protein
METVELTSSSPDPRYLAARDARLAYEDAVNGDGVTSAAWWAIASGLHIAVADLTSAGALAGLIECCRSRAVDAEQRAQYAARMLVHARSIRPIDMSSLVAA